MNLNLEKLSPYNSETAIHPQPQFHNSTPLTTYNTMPAPPVGIQVQ